VAPGPYVGIVFTMGSPLEELGRDTDETLHTVVLTREVEFAPHEVTQEEFEGLMGRNPSRHVGPDRPVENVTWFDAVDYCNALSLQEGLTPAYVINGTDVTWDREADGWRLPTEAEWERACRAGTETALFNGDLTWPACVDTLGAPDPVADASAWFCGNAGSSHHAVEGKLANSRGLHDMHGNVWEWCWDWYVADLGTEVVLDPQGPPGGSQRVIRGGSWYYFARECRSASRAPYWPNSADDIVGFRVVRNATE
ncbi:MAG: SUMF1/EgtB/PvdO family nonheme iron enzyme, partial [Candidatus Eisenbacteria bacterium]|nr:SUMF1/EgtB/PvdO family nonheme iron enzyme [Candidatus Latescibacterota bacterium]MBD3301962.1 SUMF1/EgtB/PvdO family nonheme iron enzyme [Candidatus Eisenbacteria bacterium]